jgi:hypothetical protein
MKDKEKQKEYDRKRYITQKEDRDAKNKIWARLHPEAYALYHRQWQRKGGSHYLQTRIYERTGLRCERNRIRRRHGFQYRKYKRFFAKDSELHHQWIPKTAKYRGVALAEKDAHQHGVIDVIQILEGEITLFTEELICRSEVGDV